IKRVQFNEALVTALGLRIEARLDSSAPGGCGLFWAPGCTPRVSTRVINDGKSPVTITDRFFATTGKSAQPEKTGGAGSMKLDGRRSLDSVLKPNEDARIVAGTTRPVSRPY